MDSLTVITLTLNEARNIAECLESVRWADEIIIIDSGSTDGTQDIARRYTEHIHTIEWKGYGASRNYALTQATGDWILWLDADERVTPDLAEEIRAILRSPPLETQAYSVARRAYFLGVWIRHSGWYPGRVVRLFRRGAARFTESHVHEHLKVEGSIRECRNDLIHLTDPDLHHYFVKFNRYTSLAVEDLIRDGRRFSLYDVLVRPPFLFFKMYVLRRGFLDGMHGFVLAFLSSAYVFTKYAKLWEREHTPGP